MNESRSTLATAEVLRINHYWSKSLEDGQNKVARGPVDRWTMENPRSVELWHKFDETCNAIEDREILRFVPELKRRLRIRAERQAAVTYSAKPGYTAKSAATPTI